MTGGGAPVRWAASDDEAGALSEVEAKMGITGLRVAALAAGTQAGCQAHEAAFLVLCAESCSCKWCVCGRNAHDGLMVGELLQL